MPDEIVSRMRFSQDGRTLCIVTDRRVSLVYMEDPSQAQWSVSFDNEITAVAFDGDFGVAVALGAATRVSNHTRTPGVVRYIRLDNGETLWEHTSPRSLESHFLAGGNGLIVGRGGAFLGFDRSGEQIWTFSPSDPTVSLRFFGGASDLLQVTETGVFLVAADGQPGMVIDDLGQDMDTNASQSLNENSNVDLDEDLNSSEDYDDLSEGIE